MRMGALHTNQKATHASDRDFQLNLKPQGAKVLSGVTASPVDSTNTYAIT